MKWRTERIIIAALSLLPALAGAQDAAAPAPVEVAAKTSAAAPTTAAPAGGLSQTKDQLTRMPSAADLRPNGPVTIGANHAELVQGNSAVYVGNVTLESDTLKMDGDRLELKRAADGQYTAKITGAPAHMSHTGTGPDNPPMTAQAKTVTYDSRSGTADLVGDAVMTKGDEKTTAEKITYNVVQQRYEASGGDGSNGSSGRVKIIIPQVGAPTTTAPAAGGTQPNAAAPADGTPAAPAAANAGGAAPAQQTPAPAASGTANGPKP